MDINNMTSDELAAHFSGNNQQSSQPNNAQELVNQGQGQTQVQGQSPAQGQDPNQELNLTAEQMANKFNNPNAFANNNPYKAPALDETFVSQLDELLFKKGVLNPFNNEDGTDGYIVPKTFDELSEVIRANIDHRVSETKSLSKEALLQEITRESSPAVRFILQNANTFRSADDMLPLINSVKQQDFFATLSTDTPESQEYIVRNALYLQGLDEAAINDEIEDLKSRERLETRSVQLKPILDRVSAEQTQAILQEQEAKNNQDQVFWNSYFEKMNSDLISASDIDGMEISPQYKALIANTLSPNQELGGLPLYTLIDQHVGSGNIRLLSKLALLANDEATFDAIYGSKKLNANAGSLQRTLRTSLTSNSSDVTNSSNKSTNNTQKSGYGNFLAK